MGLEDIREELHLKKRGQISLGFTAIIDLYSRKILSWRLSQNDECRVLSDLMEAIIKYGFATAEGFAGSFFDVSLLQRDFKLKYSRLYFSLRNMNYDLHQKRVGT